MRRHLAAAVAVLALAACSPKALDTAQASKLIGEHPSFAAPVDKLPLATDLVETTTGVDAGVIEGIWKYSSRDASGRPQRELTAKGKQVFKDGTGALAAPGKREIVDVGEIVEDAANKKHRSADFNWKYQVPPVVQHFTGTDTTYRGHAEFQYDGNWKVASLTLDAKPGPFAWNAELGAETRRLLSAEQDANTQRMLALEPQKFSSPDKAKTYVITVADVYVSIADEVGTKTVPFIEFLDCKVEDAPGAVNFRVDGIQRTMLATTGAGARADLEKICATTKEAHDSWVKNHPDVAERGPLGVTYSR
jgi:hypothetical protein